MSLAVQAGDNADVSDIVPAATIGEEISIQTAQRDLVEAVRQGLLVAHGRARGRISTAGPELVRIRDAIVAQRDPRDDSDPFATDQQRPHRDHRKTTANDIRARFADGTTWP